MDVAISGDRRAADQGEEEMTEWPNNGIEFNRWCSGLTRFVSVLRHFEWGKAHKFKYVNIRVDTRNGMFLVLHDLDNGGGRVDPMEIAKHVDMNLVDDGRELRNGAHLLSTAKALGWKDDGEGALEFLLRRAREIALEDCGRKVP